MNREQIAAWTLTGQAKLDDLKGPLAYWEEGLPMMVMTCDGHGQHRLNLLELRRDFLDAAAGLLAGGPGEDGPPCGVTRAEAFMALYGLIANARRVR